MTEIDVCRPTLHNGRAHCAELWQVGHLGQAAAQTPRAGVARPHLYPDDPYPGYPGGLLLVPRTQLLPNRR